MEAYYEGSSERAWNNTAEAVAKEHEYNTVIAVTQNKLHLYIQA